MVFSKVLWGGAAALALTACATAGGAPAPTPLSEASSSDAEENPFPTAEEIAAMETLSGVEFPEFGKQISAYCKRNLPERPQFIAYVAGYADETACNSLGLCAAPVLREGYQYIETEIGRMSDAEIAPGKYRLFIADAGDAQCAAHDRYVAQILAENPRTRFAAAPAGKCLAIKPILEFSSRYVLKRGPRKSSNFEKANLRLDVDVIVDRQTDKIVASSGDLRVTIAGESEPWTLFCSAPSRDLRGDAIPPLRK